MRFGFHSHHNKITPQHQRLLIEFVFWKPGRHLPPVLALLVSCCQFHRLLPFVSLRFRHTGHGVSSVLSLLEPHLTFVFILPHAKMRICHCIVLVEFPSPTSPLQNSWENQLEGRKVTSGDSFREFSLWPLGSVVLGLTWDRLSGPWGHVVEAVYMTQWTDCTDHTSRASPLVKCSIHVDPPRATESY